MDLKVKDIAKTLNVSPSTVSLVLNNKPGIGIHTRNKILNFVEEMGYTTNIHSKRLQNHNRTIRFVIYKKHGKVVADTPFFSALIEGIEQQARISGYNLMVLYLNRNDENIAEAFKVLSESNPEGILLLATEMDTSDLKKFKEIKCPLVIMDNHFPHENYDSVVINNFDSAYRVVNFLIASGHTRIGYLHSSVSITNFEERKQGVIKALLDNGLRLDNKYIYSLDSTLAGAYGDMLEIIQKKPRDKKSFPSALFADNDIIASGAVKALKEKGFIIPEDISVVGFDDMPLCEFLEPPLTTVRVYKQNMGMLALKRLVDIIECKTHENINIQVGTRIIERNSTCNMNNLY
ncbi:MAG: transcriptional regulator, LacI family [Eubacterium sp.]|nr:transcriptional regulator, LacI family [Eubacterium sp.]